MIVVLAALIILEYLFVITAYLLNIIPSLFYPTLQILANIAFH
jgi:hypothetical protein